MQLAILAWQTTAEKISSTTTAVARARQFFLQHSRAQAVPSSNSATVGVSHFHVDQYMVVDPKTPDKIIRHPQRATLHMRTPHETYTVSGCIHLYRLVPFGTTLLVRIPTSFRDLHRLHHLQSLLGPIQIHLSASGSEARVSPRHWPRRRQLLPSGSRK